MAIYRDFEELLQCLNTAKARYLLVGAHAVAIYTEPRYTKDMDVWVDNSPANAERVYKALAKFGAPLLNITAKDLTNPNMVYQIGVEPCRIDIIMGLGNLTFNNAWKKRKIVQFGKVKTPILGFHDLVKTKRAASRRQDRLDLEKLAKVKKIKK